MYSVGAVVTEKGKERVVVYVEVTWPSCRRKSLHRGLLFREDARFFAAAGAVTTVNVFSRFGNVSLAVPVNMALETEYALSKPTVFRLLMKEGNYS